MSFFDMLLLCRLMLPQFDYLDIIYLKTIKSMLNELDIVYKKVAKIALNVPITESILNVYRDMKWLPLHLRRQFHLSSYMFRIIKNQSPTNFMNKFKFISGGGGSRNANNCNLYINYKSKTHKEFPIILIIYTVLAQYLIGYRTISQYFRYHT